MTINRYVRLLPIACFVVMAGCTSNPTGPQGSAPVQDPVERGKYLVSIVGCDDCHTPKSDPATGALDMQRRLSGRPLTTQPPSEPKPGEISVSGDLQAWWGPWGKSYPANLTPDPDSGIGKRYDEAKFITTIRTGKKPEGDMLRPPMPWTIYKNMTDDDLKAIYAFLKTLTPVKTR